MTKTDTVTKASGKPELPRDPGEYLQSIVDASEVEPCEQVREILAAEQAQSSPLPKRLSDPLCTWQDEGSDFIDIGMKQGYGAIARLPARDPMAKANAKLIVASVNHAQALADALRDIRQSMIDENLDGLDRSAWRLQKTKDALQAWKEAQS